MAEPITISSDRDLVDGARNGDVAAWSELVARHEPALTRVARSMKTAGASKRVDDALATVHQAVVSGEIDVDALAHGDAQLRDVRCRGLAALTGGTVGPMLPAPNHRLDDGRRTETPDRQDLVAIAAAFVQAPWAWQTVLWHSRAEARTAAEVSPLLGRSANDVTTTLLSAESGLFELYLRADASRISDLDPTSAALLPLIGGHRRGVLSPTDRRRVDELLERRTEGSPDGVHAQRWMAVGASFESMIPEALVPGLVGQSVDRFWAVLGVGGAALGTAGLAAARSERVQRSARIGAVAAIIMAILGAAFLIRNPFDGLNASLISELIAESTDSNDDGPSADGPDADAPAADTPLVPDDGSTGGTDTSGTGTGGTDTGGAGTTGTGTGGTGTGGTGGTGTGGTVDTLDDEIVLAFPDARQGAVYVPGQDLLRLRAELSIGAPFVAGGTGTLGLAVTNDDDEPANVRLDVRSTAGISLSSASGATCGPIGASVSSCTFTLPAGGTSGLTLVFGLDESLLGDVLIVPNIPGAAIRVPIV